MADSTARANVRGGAMGLMGAMLCTARPAWATLECYRSEAPEVAAGQADQVDQVDAEAEGVPCNAEGLIMYMSNSASSLVSGEVAPGCSCSAAKKNTLCGPKPRSIAETKTIKCGRMTVLWPKFFESEVWLKQPVTRLYSRNFSLRFKVLRLVLQAI
eukprot:Skav220085  [mRNA]  locus=scaffold262:410654:416290:- [translate_table: standard]